MTAAKYQSHSASRYEGKRFSSLSGSDGAEMESQIVHGPMIFEKTFCGRIRDRMERLGKSQAPPSVKVGPLAIVADRTGFDALT